jgi:hypothetical protein
MNHNMSLMLCPRFEILKNNLSNWIALDAIDCQLRHGFDKLQNIFHFSSFQSGGTAVASRRLKRSKPRPKGQNGIGKKSKRGMLAQLRPGLALIYCKSAHMSDYSPHQSTPL